MNRKSMTSLLPFSLLNVIAESKRLHSKQQVKHPHCTQSLPINAVTAQQSGESGVDQCKLQQTKTAFYYHSAFGYIDLSKCEAKDQTVWSLAEEAHVVNFNGVRYTCNVTSNTSWVLCNSYR